MTRNGRRIVVGTMIAIHLGGNLLWPRFWWEPAYSRFALAVVAGYMTAQVNLLALWAALAPDRIMVRLPWSLFLAALMWYAAVLGFRWNDGARFTAEDAVTFGCVLLFGALVTQIPLWVANRRFRWRLAVAEDGSTPWNERQYGIRHLLAGMFLLGMALGLGRAILPSSGPLRVALNHELPFLVPTVAIWNLVVTVPCVWCAFARWSRMLPLAVGWLLYASIMGLAEVGVLILLLGLPPEPVETSLAFCVLNLVQCLIVWLTCLVLRWTGFQLLRRPLLA